MVLCPALTASSKVPFTLVTDVWEEVHTHLSDSRPQATSQLPSTPTPHCQSPPKLGLPHARVQALPRTQKFLSPDRLSAIQEAHQTADCLRPQVAAIRTYRAVG